MPRQKAPKPKAPKKPNPPPSERGVKHNTRPIAVLTDPPWEQQPNETPEAFLAFVTYRELGAARSVRAVAQAVGRADSMIARWSARWRWVDRAKAWDVRVDRERQEAVLRSQGEAAERHAQMAQTVLRAAMAPSIALLQRIREVGGEAQAFDRVPIDELARIVTRSGAALAALGKFERLSRGLEEGKLQVDVTDPEERRRRVAELRDELAARRAAKEA